tara:strand:- start:15 stop:992 length:978 start_codon:yes stop_codon:yes gene_type:complete
MSEYEYPLSTGRSNILGTEAFRNFLGQSLERANNEVIILSAFVKSIGINWLEEKLKNKNIKCTIISRWKKNDLAEGSSDLECYLLSKKNNWKFKVLKDLHAKIMLVDQKELFIGSPNLTGKGMYLIPVPNKEMGVKLEANENDVKIITSLVDESILVDDEIFESLLKWKNSLTKIEKPSYPDFPKNIKDKFNEKYNKLWVHNFPWVTAEELLKAFPINENIKHDLELFGLQKDNLEKNIIKNNLLNSKIYFWLINQIKKQENHEIYFGNLSSIIHNSLLDDPKPYRKNIKELQSNLYSYIKYFLEDNIIIDVPYEKSERLRLKTN